MPKCTVAIPVFDRREVVRGALESALSQDAADLDILVVEQLFHGRHVGCSTHLQRPQAPSGAQ